MRSLGVVANRLATNDRQLLRFGLIPEYLETAYTKELSTSELQTSFKDNAALAILIIWPKLQTSFPKLWGLRWKTRRASQQ